MEQRLTYLPSGELNPHSVEEIARDYGLTLKDLAERGGFAASNLSRWKGLFKSEGTGVPKKYCGTIREILEDCRVRRMEAFPKATHPPSFLQKEDRHDIFGSTPPKNEPDVSPTPASKPSPKQETRTSTVKAPSDKLRNGHPVIADAIESLEDVQDLAHSGKHKSANRILRAVVEDLQKLV